MILVILHHDVEFRLQIFDQIGFKEQRFELRTRHCAIDIFSLGKHDLCPHRTLFPSLHIA